MAIIARILPKVDILETISQQELYQKVIEEMGATHGDQLHRRAVLMSNPRFN